MREKAWCRISSIVGILCCILIPGLESTSAEENADHYLTNGQALLERQQFDEAIAALKTAVHMDSSLGEAYVLLGEAYGKKSDEAFERGLDAYKRAIACGGDIAYRAHKALGDLYIARGLFDEAILEYQQIVEAPFKDGEIVKNLGIAYYKAGRLNESLSMLEKGEELDGTDPEIAFYLGCIYQQKSMFEKAVQYFHRTIELAPETALALSASSKMALIEAKGTVRTVKDIQDPEVREIIQQAPDQDAYPNAGAIILLNHVEYEVHADHTMTQREHRIVKILNDRGKRYGEIKIGYDSTYETVEVVYARTIRKDGTIVHVGQKAMRDLAPWSGFPLYNNVKMKIISMPEVAEGAILEYVAIKRSIKMLGGDKFQCRLALQGQEPHRLHRLVVTVPKGTPLQTKYLRIGGLNPDISVNDDRETYTWEIRDVPEVIGEPNMPPIREISPFIMVSSWESWDEFARWWRDLYEDRIQADEGIKEQVAELIKDKDSEAERAAAIYEYVGPHIRYVGLEYGEGGYQPHKATEVFFNKYGDCKDQAMLLLSMLHTAGIKAYPVLLGAGGYGELQQDIPMSQFNHVIVAADIEGELVWMDGTSTTCSYGDIPWKSAEDGTGVL